MQRRTAHEKLMEIYRRTKNWEQLASVSQTALQDNRQWMGAAFHLGLAYLGQGKDGLAQRELTRAARLQANNDFDEAVAARAPFEVGRLLHQQYGRGVVLVCLSGPPKVGHWESFKFLNGLEICLITTQALSQCLCRLAEWPTV